MQASRKSHAALASAIVLNVVLGSIVTAKYWPTRAEAQAGKARARGDYTMTTGKSNVGGPDVICVLDAANQEMLFLRWDQSKQQLMAQGYRSLSQDAASGPGR
jgi:hypothetical protein